MNITTGKYSKTILSMERVEDQILVKLKPRRCYGKEGVHDFFSTSLANVVLDIKNNVKICECEECNKTLKGK